MGSPDMTVCGTGGASFSDVKTKVFKASCTISNSCHDATGKMGGLDLATDPYKALLNVKPVWPVPVAEQLVEVAPNSLDKSFLWKKISLATATDPKYGGRMPNTGGQTVSAEQLQIVQCWILGGAPNN